jgi:4-amino-4-deoxy-L-arabinose transferase-like glycosyltransferase
VPQGKVRRLAVEHWALALIVLLGLGLRLYAAWHFNQTHADDASLLRGDEPGYDNTALELLQGFGITWPGRVPLYPLWLAAMHWLTDSSYHAIRYAQAILATAAIPLTYLLGRRVFGHVAGLLAALAVALSHTLIGQSVHLLSEVLFTPFVLAVALALWKAWDRPSRRTLLWAGVWIGASAYVRPTLLFLPLFLFFPLIVARGWRGGLRQASLVMLATLVTVAPWIVRNRLRYDAWFPMATSNAFLWQGSPEYYHLLRHEGYTYLRVWNEVIYGPGWQQHDPTSIEGDRWWTARALRSIREEPGTYLRYAAEKLATYWIGDPNADWNNERIFSYGALRRAGFSAPAAAFAMLARLLPIVTLIAVAVLWKQRRRLLPLYAILIYCTLLHALAHAEVRLSEPLQPLLLILVAGALWQLRTRQRQPA